jgi:hypothetical protein
MDLCTLYHITSNISTLSAFAPLICCILRLKALNTESRTLFLYIIVCALTDAICFIFVKKKIHTVIVSNLFTVIECTLLTYIYFLKFETKKARYIITIFYIVFLALSIIFFVLRGGYNRYDNIISTFESCFFIALSFAFFYKEMCELSIPRLSEYYFFWLNSAFLIYFSMAFFLFLFNCYLEKCDISIVRLLYSLHLLTNIVTNILVSLGVWKIKQE